MNEIDQEIAVLQKRLKILEDEKISIESINSNDSIKKRTSGNIPDYIFIIVFVLMMIFVLSYFSIEKNDIQVPKNDQQLSSKSTNNADDGRILNNDQINTKNWIYSEENDPMTDKKTYTACTVSKNNVLLTPPYGAVDARLCIRSSPKFGTDVFVALNGDGQILCRSYEDCNLSIRYDKKSRDSIRGAGASDGSSNVVFLRTPKQVIQNLKGTNTFLIELEFYQAGSQTLEFSTNGLEWPQGKTAEVDGSK